MYGVEAQYSGGLGGLAAQTPGGDRYLGAALGIQPRASVLVGGPSSSGTLLPYTGIGDQTALPVVSADGRSVETPPEHMAGGWRQILDWHSSPAPWILLLILGLHAWLHMSARAGRSGAERVL